MLTRLPFRLFSCALVAMLSLLLTGCLQTREDQKELEEKQVVRHQLTNLQQTNADANQHVQDLEDEVRKLNGRQEVLEAKAQQSQARSEKASAANEQKEKANDQAYREEFAQLKTEVGQLKEQLAGMQAAQEESRRASQARQEAQVAQAQETAKNPLGTAEELYGKKQWKDAILSYEKYRSGSPHGKSFAVATYKIGVCFQELGMNDDAAAFYEEVIQKFPKSKEADKSSSRLKKLKK